MTGYMPESKKEEAFSIHYDEISTITILDKYALGLCANCNRTHEDGVQVASYDAQDRLTQYKDNTYQYNALGQLTEKTTPGGTETYDYDVFGNLRGVNLANGVNIEYLIDPKGRRIGKKVNGAITQKLLYLGQLNPIAELYPDNSIKNLFIYADKSNVPSAMERYDHRGNFKGRYRLISNHTIEQEIEYDVWGNVLSDSNPNFQPFYFAGGIYDTDTKLTRFGARDYDAETGRWTAKDPIGFAGGLTSLYDYVGGDPVNFVDLTGNQKRQSGSLGSGWTYDLDNFDVNGSANFEIHVKDPSGKEVGIVTKDGWINKHGIKSEEITGVPDKVKNRIRGISIDKMRKLKWLPPKGSINIKRLGPFAKGILKCVGGLSLVTYQSSIFSDKRACDTGAAMIAGLEEELCR
ncbi:MAG: hypothetical protein CSA42_07965 [Gammaproteobacteria bacterium]|nr:MAG: hypothetical protein CSA42_07965 [Gammaproteobacteria bacterium]